MDALGSLRCSVFIFNPEEVENVSWALERWEQPSTKIDERAKQSANETQVIVEDITHDLGLCQEMGGEILLGFHAKWV